MFLGEAIDVKWLLHRLNKNVKYLVHLEVSSVVFPIKHPWHLLNFETVTCGAN